MSDKLKLWSDGRSFDSIVDDYYITEGSALFDLIFNLCEDIDCLKDSLKAAEEELERVKWISVEDRLPEKNNPYLAYMTGDGEHYFQDIAWYDYTGRFYLYGQSVTHCMPLPEPPKEGIDK